MVQECPRQLEPIAQMTGQRLDTYRLGGVVPRVEDVQLELFGVKERVVGTLARDEGVETSSGGLRDHGARSPRHDPDAVHPLRAERQQPRCGARDGGQLALERVPRDVDLSPPADPHAVFLAELAAQRDAKLPCEHCIVANLGMQIEWQVSTVERDVLRDESRHAPIRAPREGLEPTPEQAMMDEQEIGSRSEEHTSELQSPCNLVCRLLLEKKKKQQRHHIHD